jgi:hypothetical protein
MVFGACAASEPSGQYRSDSASETSPVDGSAEEPDADADAEEPVLTGPRGRVRAQNGTVVTDQNTLLRGSAVWLYKYGKATGVTAYSTDEDYYVRMKQAGLNAVRVICFDPWQRTNGYVAYDWGNPSDREAFLADLDRVVELTAKHRFYALINYHDVATYDLAYLEQFWRMVAPRYADRTHVFYEITNEPVAWFPEDYTSHALRDQESTYRLVRAAAPDTHVVLLSYANTRSHDPSNSMKAVAGRLQGIDWLQASVGFHPYGTGGTSEPIVELMQGYPALNTEMNLPPSEGGDGHVVAMDGDEWGFQTMERLRVSWFTWRTAGYEDFGKNFEGKILADAQAKGYLWSPDR